MSGNIQTAPIAVLMFNRPSLTKKTLERVREAKPSAVYLITDGPREGYPDDPRLCEEVRSLATSMDWDCPVHTNFADSNMGLKSRVSSGLSWVFDHEDSAIILEDDCLADLTFFRFASELLDRYEQDDRVGMISGNNFLRGQRVDRNSYFFSADVRIWGWATWGRVWHDFAQEGLHRVYSETEVASAVGRLGAPARERRLAREARLLDRLDSWALPFVMHCLSRGFVNAVPAENLVTNVGFGADSTHTKFESFTAEVPLGSLDFPLRHPKSIALSPEAGAFEQRAERHQQVTYPLRHPLDFLGRVWRFVRS